MTKKAILKETARVWAHVEEALNFNHHNHGTKLFKLNLQEERDYRRNDGRRWGITVAESARLLSLQWLIRYSQKLKPNAGNAHCAQPTIGDILSCKPSCMYAGALMAEYGDLVEMAFADCKADVALIMSPAADYVQLVKTQQEVEAP